MRNNLMAIYLVDETIDAKRAHVLAQTGVVQRIRPPNSRLGFEIGPEGAKLMLEDTTRMSAIEDFYDCHRSVTFILCQRALT